MIFVPCEQGTDEWFAARLGVVTASRAADARARLKRKSGGREAGELADVALKYAWQLANERISGKSHDNTFETFAMGRGKAVEPVGRTVYEARFGVIVEQEGIVLTDDRRFGYSTDGRIEGENAGIEIKCPIATDKVSMAWMQPETAEEEYADQILMGLALTEWDYIDLVVYAPWLTVVGKDLFVKRIYRDEAKIAELLADLHQFRALVDEYEAALRAPAQRMFTSGAPPTATQMPLEETVPSAPSVGASDAVVPVIAEAAGHAASTSFAHATSEVMENIFKTAEDEPFITLSMMHRALGFAIPEHFISGRLGIQPAARSRRAVQYRHDQWLSICQALSLHASTVQGYKFR
jgi:exodeoxyribonuclease (lambda-induced)